MKKSLLYSLVVLAILQPIFSAAQERPIRTRPTGNLPGRLGNITGGRSFGGSSGGAASGDSLQHRDYSEDSVAITFRFPFSTQSNKLDTSIRDFTTRFPIPAHHVFLGNLGTATRSILFTPE
ncbi:MAG: hypothetical protein HC867_04660 [Bacteroidia bacterium]|nr:hypothetical protein [Bacteroidia bacterium]